MRHQAGEQLGEIILGSDAGENVATFPVAELDRRVERLADPVQLAQRFKGGNCPIVKSISLNSFAHEPQMLQSRLGTLKSAAIGRRCSHNADNCHLRATGFGLLTQAKLGLILCRPPRQVAHGIHQVC
jgi:hypothetical protein